MLNGNKFLVNGLKGAKAELNYIIKEFKNLSDITLNLYVITPFGLNKIQDKKGVIKDINDIPKDSSNYPLLMELRGIMIQNKIKIRKCYYGRPNLEEAGGYTECKYYYAIKEGVNGVTNTIVESWEECEPLVKGGLSIYKKFVTKEECLEYFKTVDIEGFKKKARYQQEKNEKLKKLKEDYTEVKVWLKKDIISYLNDRASKENINVAKLLNDILMEVMEDGNK